MILVERIIWVQVEIISSLNSMESLVRSDNYVKLYSLVLATSGKLKKLQHSDTEYENVTYECVTFKVTYSEYLHVCV